ncbi:MAG: hypothetical protein GY801_04090 [bacterium]|nr:hypothetical protein [bacterium]
MNALLYLPLQGRRFALKGLDKLARGQRSATWDMEVRSRITEVQRCPHNQI